MSEATNSEPQVVLYDASAVQNIPFKISDEDEIDPVVLTFQPLDDIRYSDYAAATSTRLVDDGKNITTSSAAPGGKLWDELVTSVRDIEFEDAENGALPTDWKEAFDLLQFKLPSLNFFLAVSVYEKPKTANGKFVVSRSNERAIYADLYFNGKAVTTTHYIQKTSFEFAKELEKTQRIPIGGKAKGLKEAGDLVFPSSAKGKSALYDKMRARAAEGFANDFVPMRVKERIIDYIARSVIEQKK